MNKIMRTFLIVCSALLIASIGGISALWQYSTNTVNATNIQHNITMEEFYYKENVPDDEEGELSHNSLLEKVIDPVEGLNNSNSLLSKAVKNRLDDNYDNVSSNQQVSGGNLKNVFSTIEGFENVGFLLVYINEEHYEIYTYDNRDTNRLNVSVETYLTNIYLREGRWVLSGGYAGIATSAQYDGKTNGPYKNTINPDTFIRK